jgi:hypothetical protein
METKQVGKLTLRTFDILQNNTLSNTDNDIGTITANAQFITWKNVNMRLVLGDIYDKYDKFNIRLVAYSHRPPTTNLTVVNNVLFYLSGTFSFAFGSYNHATRSLRNETCIGGSVLRTGAVGSNNTFYQVDTTILKPREYENISIEYKNSSTQVINGLSEKINQMIGHSTFILEFVGVDEK